MQIGYANREQIAELLCALTPIDRFIKNGVFMVNFRELLKPVSFDCINNDAIAYIENTVKERK